MNWRAFLKGVASINLFGELNYRNPYAGKDPLEADREAIRSDWEAVGEDLRQVMEQFEREHAEELAAARKRKKG